MWYGRGSKKGKEDKKRECYYTVVTVFHNISVYMNALHATAHTSYTSPVEINNRVVHSWGQRHVLLVERLGI